MLNEKQFFKKWIHGRKDKPIETLRALYATFLERIYTEMGARDWALFMLLSEKTLTVKPIEQAQNAPCDAELLLVRKLYFFSGMPVGPIHGPTVRIDFIKN